MKKLYLSRLIKLIALVIPVILFVVFTQHFLFFYNDSSTTRVRHFYLEAEESLDVVFLGASELFNGYSPGYAYDRYGYTSYMYAIANNHGSLYSSEVKEILSRQKPQIIFVEIGGFTFDENHSVADEARVRALLENIPFSRNKLQIIQHYPYEDKLSLILPFIKYHGNWTDLVTLSHNLRTRLSDDFSPSLLKGLATRTVGFESTELGEPKPFGNHISEEAEKDLIDFLTFCRQTDVENIVFISLPRFFTGVDKINFSSCANDIRQIVTQYGYPYLDLYDQNVCCLNGAEDYYDEEHLNIYGQRKVTDYLGNLIIHQYCLTPMAQTPENQSHWEKCVQYTNKYFAFAEQCYLDGEDVWLTEEAFLNHLNTGTP